MYSSKLNVTDFFSGSGIMSYGFKKTGFLLNNGFELDLQRCKVYDTNLSVKSEPVDLLTVSPDSISLNFEKYSYRPRVVTGCPPCQSFSSLHRTRGVLTDVDSRTVLVEKYGELAKSLTPNVIVFENVSGILVPQNRAYFERYLRILESDYKTSWSLIDAADYGIPQHRKRVLALSVRKDLKIDPSLPVKTHSKNGLGETRKWSTVKWAIGDLKPLESGEADSNDCLHRASSHSENTLKIIKAIPKNGGSRKSLPPELVLPCHRRLAAHKGAESVYGRMKWDEPSPTITGASIRPSSGRFIHPEQDRGITLREMARLQTIPDTYKFVGSKDAIASMIGDAVPFILAKAIANHVKGLLREAGIA